MKLESDNHVVREGSCKECVRCLRLYLCDAEDCAIPERLRGVFTVTVTVTEALVLHPLLEDRGRITESIRCPVPIDKIKQKCFQITTKRVRRSQQFHDNIIIIFV